MLMNDSDNPDNPVLQLLIQTHGMALWKGDNLMRACWLGN